MSDIRYITTVLSEEAILEQLVEECGELVQAAAKRLRIIRGENPTPTDLDANFEDLVEEMGDVFLCIMAAEEKLETRDEVLKVVGRKTERWRNRIERRER